MQTEEIKHTATVQNQLTCRNCSATLTFKPGTTSLKCEYCGAENAIKISKEKIEEIDYLKFIRTKGNEEPKQEITTVKCDGCGASTTFDPAVVAAACDFCGTPLVVKNASKSIILRPKSLLPFNITQKDSTTLFQDWLKGLWFAPSALKKYARQGKLAGVYIPYWTFDAKTSTDYEGERGDDYQETETYYENGQQKTRTVTRTEWTDVSGNVRDDFDDVVVVASKSLPTNYIDRLEPWDTQNLVPFDEQFLSGFKTECYQVGLENGFQIAKDKMEDVIESHVQQDIGGDHQKIGSMDTTFDDITFKHILLPLWISAYRYNDKVYRFMINGRSGEVQGERPYSAIKIALAIIAVIIIIALIAYFSKQA